MATRVTLPPLDSAPPAGDATGTATAPVPVAKAQLLNDRGDREAEAEWLKAAARPGVIPLLSTSTDPFTIVTAHAGSRTMRTARLDPAAGLELTIQVAELLAGLHRDGFAHGKLTVDHIILGADGPVLCSPDGTITEAASDLAGLARCMRELGRQWDELERRAPWRDQWDRLALRLEEQTDPSSSATRTAQALRRMADTKAPPVDLRTRRLPSGVVLAAAGAVVAIAGLALAPADEPATATGPELEMEGSTYVVGREGDDVAYLPSPCDPAAPVVLLRPSSGEVWAFADIADGASSAPMAVVPGATELRREVADDRGCDVAVARGPAGATVIDTAGLTADLVSTDR